MSVTDDEARALQMLVTGFTLGAMSRPEINQVVEAKPAMDDQGNYLPWFWVTGRQSSIRLKISVTVDYE